MVVQQMIFFKYRFRLLQIGVLGIRMVMAKTVDCIGFRLLQIGVLGILVFK